MDYVLIPSDIFFFIFGFVCCIIVEIFLIVFVGKREQRKRREAIENALKGLKEKDND